MTPYQEARTKLDDIRRAVIELESLTDCDNLKYLTRVQREAIFTVMLEGVGALEDTIKAIVREGRNVKRARLRDDETLSRMIKAMTEHGLCVSQFETDSQVVGQYQSGDGPDGQSEPAPLATSLADDIAAALKLVKGSEGE